MDRLRSAAELCALRQRIVTSRDVRRTRVVVCAGTGCRANGSLDVARALEGALRQHGVEATVELKLSGCHGFCQQGPVVVVEPQGIFYRAVGRDDPAADAAAIVVETVLGNKPVERLLYEDPGSGRKIAHYEQIPFYAKQHRIALKNNGRIDPNSVEDYIAVDGYSALAKTLAMDPEEVIDWIKRSGLRGRGGGGFPTGLKWSFCRAAECRSVRYVICNADEGDPGAFMDRSIMEGDPHSVLEGMAIGAFAMSRGICAAEGYIYIRAEYPLAVANIRQAIRQAEEYGLLGDDVLGSGLAFHVKVKEGAGAFVCGEETALLASIEGRRGMPRTRPPFPANEGLYGKPSNINNVETWANVPRIINGGPDWYASIGTETSKGTKVFSLVGKVNNSGLVEVPMGITLREIVFDIGGGVPDGKRLKAVQTGGPSGGCIPAKLMNLPVDYEKLSEAGSIMGSGGLVVMDEDTCMVDIARYFIEFMQSESCGKCVPCRLGTKQMLSILNDITSGRGRPEQLDLLAEIAQTVKLGSLCGLGQTAPNPVLTTLRHFRDEYEAHIRGKCPAAVCRGLVSSPCKHTCPAGVDVPRYIRYIAAGRYADALDVILEKMPFPEVCGRVCFHPCESKCRRALLDEPVSVRALKRFAAEQGARSAPPERAAPEPTGKRVAVVGSGPAGLTAAYYLARLGHGVVVYEKDAEPGGTLCTGIPAFRLPREVVRRDVERVRDAGVAIRTNAPVTSLDDLTSGGCDAVVLACGAPLGLKMGIPGEDDPRVLDCLTFLRRVNAGEDPRAGDRVAVVGGGSSAMDAARTALRLGAGEVTVVYRRTRHDMPAGAEECEEAAAEGVRFEFLAAPVAVRPGASGLDLDCIRMEPGPVDASGRRRPVPVAGSEFTLQADSVIMAIGQQPEPLGGLEGETDGRGRLRADDDTLCTGREGVFGAGDMVTGPESIIEAIAAGRRVAASVDVYLGGTGDIDELLAPPEEVEDLVPLEEQETLPRVPLRARPAGERAADFDDVELCYTEEEAQREAMRCLRCDLEEWEEG